MNRGHGRLVFCACLTLLIGCGARTSTLEDELGGQDAGGASGNAGSDPSGGAPLGGAPAAGFGFGGSHPTPTAGAPSAGAPFGGAPAGGFGGAPFFAGAPSGGFGAFAGFGGFAGFGAIGGDAGTGGIEQLCGALGGSTCAECQCKTCAPAIDACFSDVGCAAIFLCAQQTGCNLASCYAPGTCKAVIDTFGGLGGPSIQNVFSLATCAASAQANCGCN